MPSYKIHSLKDNKKLSFIIEWESSGMIEMKLWQEGYIVLSVEEVKPDDMAGYFCFEGKKQDNSPITGKISAETIFQAYEMLTREYSYILDKLYPSHITDPVEQQKIFAQLQYSFQREVVKKVEPKKDTSQEYVEKNKRNIEQLIQYLQTSEIADKEKIITELRKIQQMNNNSTIEQTLKDIIRNIYDLIPDKKKVPPIVKTIAVWVRVFLVPPFLLSLKKSYIDALSFLDPVMHEDEKIEKIKNIQDRKKPSLDDVHINKLLQAEYRKSISWMTEQGRRAFLYSFFRERHSVFLMKRMFRNIFKISASVVMVLVFWLGVLSVLGYYSAFFFTWDMVGMLLIVIAVSLVFPDRTV